MIGGPNIGGTARVAICVPVRDEQRALPGLLKSLAGQIRGGDVCVVMAFDGCRDDSEAVARTCAAAGGLALRSRSLPRLATPDAGRARVAALALGREGLATGDILLTTDADTRPMREWVTTSVNALKSADLVCGHIQRDRRAVDAWRDPIEHYLDRLHAVHRSIDPVAHDATPSHWHEGGASMGFTVAAWDRIATLPLPPTGEDRAMVRHARLAGLAVRQDPRVRVVTSSRHNGRAVGGLADALRDGRRDAVTGCEPMMEHPDDVIDRIERSAIARAAFPVGDVARLAVRLGIAEAAIIAAASASSADAFATALPLVIRAHRAVSLGEASRLLEQYETPSRVDAA